jgi:hypothetical protein
MSCTNSRNLVRKNDLKYCRWFIHFIQRGTDILDKVFCIDEAWFHISEYINNKNSRIWSAETLHIFLERLLHSLKVGRQCAVNRG